MSQSHSAAARARRFLLATMVLAIGAGPAAAAGAERMETPISSASPQTDVLSSVVSLRLPLPAGTAPHPEACDWIQYERFRSAAGPADATQAASVAVLMPGILEGATAFDPLARNTVREAARRGKSVEVWAIDRRANCLEDHRGVDALEGGGDPDTALDYYYRGTEIDGHTFAGFRQNDRVLADIGITQTVNDYNAVLTRELPSQPWREQHVICGGHSLGGPLTEIYASWDFDGNPATTTDAGYRQCAGFIGFDTSLNGGTLKTSTRASKDLMSQLTAGTLSAVTKASTKSLKAGAIPRHVNLLGIAPETMTLLELVGARASSDPQGDATSQLQSIPRNTPADTLFHLNGSATLGEYLTTKNSLRDFKYTNAALLGQIMDDNGGVLGLVRASFGYPDGVRLIRNRLPSQIGIIPGIGTLVEPGPLMIPRRVANQPLQRWKNYDELGSGASQIGAGITTPEAEVTDATDFARILHEGPLNLTENWFPIRIMADLGWLSSGDRSGAFANARYPNGVTLKPRFGVIAGDGVLGGVKHKPVDPQVVLPGYQHLDVLTAAEHQNNGQPEGSSEALVDLMGSATAP